MSSSHVYSRNTPPVTSTRNGSISFAGPAPTQLEFDSRSTVAGSHNDAGVIREALAEGIRSSGKSRAQISEEMTYLVGRKITDRMLNGYTAASAEDYLFPAELARAFCTATGSTALLDCIAELHGLRVITQEESELITLGRAFLQRNEAQEQIEILQKRLHGRVK